MAKTSKAPKKSKAAKPTNVAPGTPAHKAGKQTSYVASGILPPPQLEVESGSAIPTVIRETVPELVSPTQRRIVYASMLNDASVDVSVRAIKTPVLGAEYYMDPYSDDPNDVMISQFIWDNLNGGMSSPLYSSLEDIVRFFEDGYTVLEKVYELRSWSPGGTAGANSKTYTMLKKLGIRSESTISDIVYDDNGGVAQVSQQAIRADKSTELVDIDISKILVFTFNRRGGDIRGKSILRTAYPHWYYKTHLYKIDAIQKERHALGIPVGKLLPGATEQDKAVLRTLLRNLRTNEEAFAIITPTVELELLQLNGSIVDVMHSIEHHNAIIMLNVMAQFLNSSGSSSAARAASATQVDMFMKSLKFISNYIAEVINQFLIPELVIWNFPTTNFPKLQVKNIGETKDLQMLAAALANMLAQGGLTPDLETENFFRKIFGMPSKQLDAAPTVAPSTTSPGQNGNQAPPANGNTPAPAGQTTQKGNIKNGKGTGNVGKSPSSPH